MLAIIVPIAVLVVVYGGLALIAWRRPMLGRLAWREAIRRPALLIYAVVLVVTVGPAVRASHMHASEALRIVG